MKFVEQMEASFLREFPDVKGDLGLTLNTAMQQVQKRTVLSEVEEDALNEMSFLLSKYNQINKANKEKRPAIEKQIYAIADLYKIDNIDNIIAKHSRSTISRTLDLMTSK